MNAEDIKQKEQTMYRTGRSGQNPFAQICRQPLQNPSLSLQAKGLLAYLLSLPDDWKIYESEIIKHATNGRDSHRRAFKELIKAGYICRHQSRTGEGTFNKSVFKVFELPFHLEAQKNEGYLGFQPRTGNPSPDNPSPENQTLIDRYSTDRYSTDIYPAFSESAHTHPFPLNNEIGEGKDCANKAIMDGDVVKSTDSASNDDCCIIYNMENNDLDTNTQTQKSEKNNTILKKDFDTKGQAQKAKKKAKTKASTLNEDWTLPPEWRQWALDASGWTIEFIEGQADKFHDHHLSKETKAVDWFASWRFWCRNSAEYKGVSLKTKQQIKALAQKNTGVKPPTPSGHIPLELKKEWGAVQAQLRERVGDAKFKSWLEHLSPIYPFQENKLTIKAPTRFTKDHVSQHFYQEVKNLCVKAMGVKDVEFVVRAAP